MGAAHLRGKAADYLRLARGLSAHSPTRRHLIILAERLERQAKEIYKRSDDTGARREESPSQQPASQSTRDDADA